MTDTVSNVFSFLIEQSPQPINLPPLPTQIDGLFRYDFSVGQGATTAGGSVT